MKIKHIQIKNYRSIRRLDFELANFSILLGANNSGKSNILRALNFFFQGSEKITPEDVFSFFEEQETEVSVDITFGSLSEQERKTFKKYLLNNGTIKIKKSCKATKDENGNLTCTNPIYNGWIEEPDLWFLKDSAFERLSSKEKREFEVETFPELAPLLEIEGRFTKDQFYEFQERYIVNRRADLNFIGKFEEAPLFGRQNVASGILPELFFIPAIRELTDETKVNSRTLLGKLLLNVLDTMIENDENFQKLILDIQTSIDQLNCKQKFESPIGIIEEELSEQLASWGVSTSIEISSPDITKIFEMGTTLNIDDGVMTGAEAKGNGLQRAIIFGLVKIHANQRKTENSEIIPRASSESKVYAIEEAELYLHPHKQREFYNNLKKIAEDTNTQVIITTHSSHFIRMEDYQNLILIRKDTREIGTTKNQCCNDIFDPSSEEKQHYKLLHYINPDNGELFFARKVVLVEGETEKVVMPYLSERLGIFQPDVSIIACASKNNLPFYIKLLNHFRIPYVVIYDEDPNKSSYDKNEEIEKLVDLKIGKTIMLRPDFEGHFSLSNKNNKAFNALKHFQSIDDASISKNMIDVLKSIYK